jgi:tRNA-specific 2-thiouridylase
MAKRINKTVFVGVSGGVDSSVACALLKDQGYNVVGVFIHTWTPDFIKCTWRSERRDAMRVCAHLNIPFLECDAEKEYKEGVADYMIEEYKAGRTPNPDVMCNRTVKFGVFWKFAKAHGADFIATGHYACVMENSFREATGGGVSFRGNLRNGVKELRKKLFSMERAIDLTKDQGYFLWTLTQDDLSHTLFPIGHLKKTEVRKLAEKYKIPVAMKKDSQGVCFLGPLDMKDFLKHYIKSEKGNVLDVDGKVIGTHDGAVFFTKGERHGFNIFKNKDNSKPLYVIAKDVEKNTITVSVSSNNSFSLSPRINIINTNWICNTPEKDKNYTSQIRYHGELFNCKINITGPTCGEIIFDKNVLVDSGQSIVVYEGDICLGGGVVN